MSNFCFSWPMFNRIFHQVELMDRMMDVVGVDPAVAVRVDEGAAWYEARTNCLSCCHECECHNWLECSDGRALPPDFCPNVAFFRRCTQADAGNQLGACGVAAWNSARSASAPAGGHGVEDLG